MSKLLVVTQWDNSSVAAQRTSTSDPYVKFKLEGKQFYKSKVVYKNLNPRWNESFSHPLRDREHQVEVYDKNRTTDDFMGSCSIDLKNLELYRLAAHYLLLFPIITNQTSFICIFGLLSCQKLRDRATSGRSQKQRRRYGRDHRRCVFNVPRRLLGVTLVEGQDLPQSGVGDVYVRFRLGEQKYKSHVSLWATPNPQWREQFDLNQFEDCQEPLQVEVFSKRGRKGEEQQCFNSVWFIISWTGKCNPFCVVEVSNSRLQTHTMFKTVNPEWNKALAFPIKDIHEVIEVTVMDENGDNFLGKVAVPLLTVKNGQQICLFLKKEDLARTYKGTITLEIDVIYNKVRAGIKTFKPKETKLTEETPKFNKKVLAQNIYRVRRISTAVLYTLQYINSCFQWESTQRSLIAFLIFLVTVWHWELFMLPLFLFVLIGWNYFQLSAGKVTSNQDVVNISMAEEDEDDEKDASRKGLMDKIHMVQEVVLVVQNVLEELANIGERVKNIFNWSVPFVSCLAGLMLFIAATLLYFIPLRYLVLIWGVNKFTKKLRNPYTIDNNEILDFLKRVPSDVQKVRLSGQSRGGPLYRRGEEEMKCHTHCYSHRHTGSDSR
uniref:C2 domain-containing protein n=1 Tax=Periophthalmus magnuspinnatus TaxID=409849 RepID=A0A3B4B6B1_9GOBI